MSVPVQIRDGSVVLTSIEHDEVEQGADRKASPNPQVVVHLDLPNWHPLKLDHDFKGQSCLSDGVSRALIHV